MRLKVAAVVAVNTEDLTQIDFSREAWEEFRRSMEPEGVIMADLTPDKYESVEIDGDQCLYSIKLDVRALRNMWTRSESKSTNYVPHSGGWLDDTCIPPWEWQCPGRGEDAYWYWGLNCRYTIGITVMDIENAEITA